MSLPSVRNELPPAMPRKLTRPNVPSLVTPGVSSTNESTRRPLIGRLSICAVVTTWETPVFVVSTIGAPLVTSTVCVAPETAKETWRFNCCPTSNSMSLRSYGAESLRFYLYGYIRLKAPATAR